MSAIFPPWLGKFSLPKDMDPTASCSKTTEVGPALAYLPTLELTYGRWIFFVKYDVYTNLSRYLSKGAADVYI